MFWYFLWGSLHIAVLPLAYWILGGDDKRFQFILIATAVLTFAVSFSGKKIYQLPFSVLLIFSALIFVPPVIYSIVQLNKNS